VVRSHNGSIESGLILPLTFYLLHPLLPCFIHVFMSYSKSYSPNSRRVIHPISTNRPQFTLQLSFNDTDATINSAQRYIVPLQVASAAKGDEASTPVPYYSVIVSGNEVGVIMEGKTANGREGGTPKSVAVTTDERVKSTLGGGRLNDAFQRSEAKSREQDELKEVGKGNLKSVGIDRGVIMEGERLADLVKTCKTETLELQEQVLHLKKEVVHLQEMLREEQKHWSTMKTGTGKESERFSIKLRTQLFQLRLRSLLVAP
jgi:hypothetical protein